MKLLDGNVLPGDMLMIDGDLKKSQMTFQRAAAKATN
jgi:hypothetical protein